MKQIIYFKNTMKYTAINLPDVSENKSNITGVKLTFYELHKKKFNYLLISFLSLVAGLLCYILFRESTLLINDVLKIKFLNIKTLDDYIFINFVRYNLPDGLWILSGILFLRSIWIENKRFSQVYVCVFIMFAMIFEILQNFKYIPGTFDVLDLITMGIFAVIEQIIYKFSVKGVSKND